MNIPETYIDDQVSQALEEDIGGGDITARLIPEDKRSNAEVICREPAILCGKEWFNRVFEKLSNQIELKWQKNDSEEIKAGEIICYLSGPARAMLTGERTALNFLQTLSATASTTHQYVKAIIGTNCQILDTRKTLPGYRLAQKYAVHCGGGSNHRFGLYDMVLRVASLGNSESGLMSTLVIAGISFRNARRFALKYLKEISWKE